MKAVGIVLVGIVAFFVIKSIVSMIISLLVTVLLVGAGIALLSLVLRQNSTD